jgi:hypothetical protein
MKNDVEVRGVGSGDVIDVPALVERLLELIPVEETQLRGQLIEISAASKSAPSNYWWKRAVQMFGNRVFQLREEAAQAAIHRPAPQWIKSASDVIAKAVV